MSRPVIGIIGTGNIAIKAYLPIYAQMHHQVDWRVMSRHPEVDRPKLETYGLAPTAASVSDLLDQQLDAMMIHTPTSTHATIVRQCLEAGVSVYVDKPLAEDEATSAALYQLAKAKGLLLTVGFNRRFAPAVATLTEIQNISTIRVLKTTPTPMAGTPKSILYDMFIHPLDTALVLSHFAPVVDPHTEIMVNAQNELTYASLRYRTGNCVVSAELNLQAGADLEIAEVTSPAGVRQVRDLTQTSDYTLRGELQSFPNKWASTSENRGFAPLVRAFVAAVNGEAENPILPMTSMFSHHLIALMTE